MQIRLLIIVFFLCAAGQQLHAQSSCDFQKDTMTLPFSKKVVEGDLVRIPLKKGSEVTFLKAEGGKMYLRLLVKENFYFDKVDVLEIRSGSKSYYAKETRQYKVDKTTGLFVIEIFSNYLTTLKEEGITSIVFNKAETDFTRNDANEIKRTARCFYESFAGK
jgi:hypothetical protein